MNEILYIIVMNTYIQIKSEQITKIYSFQQLYIYSKKNIHPKCSCGIKPFFAVT